MATSINEFQIFYSPVLLDDAAATLWRARPFKMIDYAITVAVVLACVATVVFHQREKPVETITSCAMAIALFWLYRFLCRKMLCRRLRSAFSNVPNGILTFQISDDRLTITSRDRQATVPWREFLEPLITEKYILLRRFDRNYVLLPRAQLHPNTVGMILAKCGDGKRTRLQVT